MKSSRFKLITISGHPGAGKGTIGKLMARRLHLKHYSMGDVFRSLATAKGMTLQEFERYVNKHPQIDRELDAWQGQMARRLGRGIFEGRVSFHFIPQSYKIFLAVSLSEAAKRIWTDTGAQRRYEGAWKTRADVRRSLTERISHYAGRYKKNYQLNIFSRQHYHDWIDTTRLSPSQVAEQAIEAYRQWAEKQIHVEKTRKKPISSTPRAKQRRKPHR